MHITTLYQSNFRNLAENSVSLVPGINLFSGDNGQGKTNFLETLFVLSAGKSFRASKNSALISLNAEKAVIEARLVDSVGNIDLGLEIFPGKKTIKKNGNRITRASDFFGTLLTVSFSPDDLSLVKGGPSERRKFMDKYLVDIRPPVLGSLVSYQKALKQKASLLKEGASYKMVRPWNHIIADEGMRIISARKNLLESISDRLQHVYSEHFSKSEEVSIEYYQYGVDQGELEDLSATLESFFPRESAARVCLFGPHRDDFLITLSQTPARHFASQGQMRSIVLSLKLVMVDIIHSARGDFPVILLDDVDSELDFSRRSNLLHSLLGGDRQVIVTSTSLDPDALSQEVLSRSREIQRFVVKNGIISLAEV